MSYNIDTWKTKEIKSLRIPVASLFTNERKDWHPEQSIVGDTTMFTLMDSCIVGRVVDGVIEVDAIFCKGEGSGTAMNWIFEPALKESTGILIASCVWEGGDSVNQLRVKDGVVEWVDIEL